MAPRVRAALALAALLGVLAGCSGSPSGSASASAGASAAAPSTAAGTAATCTPIDLVLPSGDPVDLSGTWRADDLALYQVRQLGECLWLVGQNGTFTYVFEGRLNPDFTATGRWAVIAASDHLISDTINRGRFWIGTGTATMAIEAGSSGDNASITLKKESETVDPEYRPAYPIAITTWTRVDDTPDHPFPTP